MNSSERRSSPIRAVVLLSGGLDSRLAVRILQEQNVEVHALNFKTLFACCQDNAAQAARDLGTPLTIVGDDDDEYLDLIRRPKHGYGKGANPCVDCRIYMFERARVFMEQIGAELVASGEVAGQRPMSQKRRDLLLIAAKSGLRDRLLRPLSAKLLPPTLPEIEGSIDREGLYGFSGRGRKPLIDLARQFGFADVEIPSPSTGCMLTETTFAGKVHDLVQLSPESSRWDFELLKTGRHFRVDARTKVIVGRHEEENHRLQRSAEQCAATPVAVLIPENFSGPTAMIVGDVNERSLAAAEGLIHRYAREPGETPTVVLRQKGEQIRRAIAPAPIEAVARL